MHAQRMDRTEWQGQYRGNKLMHNFQARLCVSSEDKVELDLSTFKQYQCTNRWMHNSSLCSVETNKVVASDPIDCDNTII